MILFMMFYFMLMMFLMFYFNFMYLYMMKSMYLLEWVIYMYYSFKFSFIMYLDWMSMVFLMTVALISLLIYLYSVEYMEGDNLERFGYLLLLFIFSMMFMILSPSILTILLGWDGLGLSSYCLIIYYQNMNAYNSGMLTIFMNRIGDVGILLLICMGFMVGSMNMLIYCFDKYMMYLLMLICFTKSAQMPFSLWLPAAMMAPTPVSALVHSSTLVTAGIYLMIRYNMFMYINNINEYMLLISSLTMLMAGFIANYEFDFKKIIALSTLSQLGLMMSILSLGMWELSFFHLIIHALFKSLMFLCVGSFIHYFKNNQDIRLFGGLLKNYPFKVMVLIFSLMNLMGFPFLSGYFSKDLIMEYMFMNKLNFMSFLMLILGTVFTMSYSSRMILFMIFYKNSSFMYMYKKESMIMNFCMFLLFFMLINMGFMFMEMNYYFYMMMMTINQKMLILKMMIVGLLLGMFYYMYSIKQLGFYLTNMYLLSMMYKLYYFPLKFMMNIEIIYDKNLVEFSMMLIKLKLMMNYKLMKNEFNLMNLLMLYILLVFLIN
uniref:NADH:ubiquinone reductase (H(+)-translocating) n=1 Tax=Euaspis polynesia TaxID=1352276 RepID=A0A7T4WNZ5_9HYME|nr:NADH dehydrogenase subunit 5 [Euaspis polynesia]QQD78163.1 NADH dehydrogenase subunit 5 [Euaspis polynesia]